MAGFSRRDQDRLPLLLPLVVARSPDRATASTAGLPYLGDLRSGSGAWSGDHAPTESKKPQAAGGIYLVMLTLILVSWLIATLPFTVATARTVRLGRLPGGASVGTRR